MISGGSKAKNAGNQLEEFFKERLISLGYEEIKHLIFNRRDTFDGKQFAKQVDVGQTIYGTKRVVDFIVFIPNRFPEGLIIECKWQESPGSVDEKYPYLLYNILKTGVPSIVLLDGGGYKEKAGEWLKSQVNSQRLLIGVYTMAELQKKINAGFF